MRGLLILVLAMRVLARLLRAAIMGRLIIGRLRVVVRLRLLCVLTSWIMRLTILMALRRGLQQGM